MANPLLKTRQIADLQVTNGKLASDVGRANLLTNGGFEIWQRGNGPFTLSALYNADTWRQYMPAGTTSVSRDGSNGDVSGYCAAVTIASPSTNGLFQVVDVGSDVIGRTLSFSVRVKCSQANSVRCGIQSNKAASLPSTWSGYHSGGGGYETLTVTWAVAAGSGGVTVWVLGSVAGTFYADNAMLVVGSVAADYAPLHPADDLARCLRYYEVIGGQTVGVPQFFGYSTNTQWSTTLPYKARKAVSPVVTKTGTWAVTNCNQPSLVGELDSVVIYTVVTATGHFNMASNAAGQTITIEANP